MLFVAAVFAPLLGALLGGFGGRAVGGRAGDRLAQFATVGFMVIASVCAVAAWAEIALGHTTETVMLGTWVDSGTLEVSWALRYDALSASMIAMITVVATLIHVYSIGYMSHDPSVPRFMAYLSLFTFAMLMLVSADNLLQLFFGWEGVGLASYLLIGFWYERDSARAAAQKAFVVNRVGDLAFAIGMAVTYWVFGSIEFQQILTTVPEHAGERIAFAGLDWPVMELIALLLFLGAMGKSAQLGLHVWLPDAMEGPTPVSALIHAATMVTAGVFLLARMSPLFEAAPHTLTVVTLVGAATALFAATVGCVQNDIKRVIAYSTCSQLGYMFFAAGVSAYPAAIFHLITHAFFKALLFLSAGSVIHAMSDEQDIRKMGGIWSKVPITYAMMWIGSLALAGIPYFAGYFSKDMILEVAWGSHLWHGQLAFWAGVIAAFLTAFYSWRLLILVFHGKPRADHHTMEHVHESPLVMTVPLMLLALGAVASGWLLYELFVGHDLVEYWGGSIAGGRVHEVMEAAHHVPEWVKLAPVVAAASGIALAAALYLGAPRVPALLADRFAGLYRFLLNKWYFDELYDAVFVKPARRIGEALWKQGDGAIIDGLGPDGVAATSRAIAGRASRLQSGLVTHYAFAMLAGVVGLVTLYLLTR